MDKNLLPSTECGVTKRDKLACEVCGDVRVGVTIPSMDDVDLSLIGVDGGVVVVVVDADVDVDV
jgi:hypothetical protein